MLWDVSLLKCLSSLTKFLKYYVIEKETCINRSLSITVFYLFDVRMRSVNLKFNERFLIFPMLNSTETIKNWSKWKLSEVSKFSISSIGQNQKLENLENGYFFFSNRTVKLKFFLLEHFFDFEFYILPTIKVK